MFYFEIQPRKRVLVASGTLTAMLVCDRSAAVLKVGGGAAVKERSVAGRTEPDMREKGKHCSRSAGFVDRRVIVHRSADRGAMRLFSSAYSLLSLLGHWVAVVPLLRSVFE